MYVAYVLPSPRVASPSQLEAGTQEVRVLQKGNPRLVITGWRPTWWKESKWGASLSFTRLWRAG